MIKKEKPKVSVIMGIYNCAGTLRESIESILSQTYENWEFIICDDASTDNSYDIASQYAEKYPNKIILIKNDSNLRLANSLNNCLELATGKYIARHDGDDISLPERFEKQVDFLEKNLEYQVVGSSMIAFDEKGIRGTRVMSGVSQASILAYSTPFCHATIMMRAETYDSLRGYRVCRQTRRMEDIDLWIRFFEKGYQGYNLEEPFYMVREDENAYKRRKFIYSIDNAFLIFQACRRLNLSLKSYMFVLKPIISSLTPNFIMNLYHKKSLSK
ncbi:MULTISPECIES: glycosyltransferase family 2 protein [Bacillus cereus group]|uniref:glycosyltransferase family 2 protein n=1 Tax=Bacillus cereus group TaxID=86661 RepID=UPI0002EE7B6D|nr:MULTISPECIES: glycosyltransferase family 2 protein [Bacillus cereus group]